MPEAPRRRPEKHAVVRGLREHVRARPSAVFAAVDARLRPAESGRSLYRADPAAFFIIVQGVWWYRGEYRIVPDETGSHLEYTIVNVAQHARQLSEFKVRRALTSAPTAFAALAKSLRAELE
ncbi:MAG: hypothetical protein ABI400_07240 [Lacisediminihabitans sp.]